MLSAVKCSHILTRQLIYSSGTRYCQNRHSSHLLNTARQGRGTIPSALPNRVPEFLRKMSSKQGFKVSPSEQWWTQGSLAIVTGANKGIGKAAAQILAQNGLRTIVAARDGTGLDMMYIAESRGTEAVEDLKKVTGSSEIYFEQLDISDASSVKSFASRIKDKHKDVAILINNAGIAFKGSIFGPEEARQTLDVNFLGTKNVCEAILPLIPTGGRVVNVCSMAGKQRIIKSPELLQRFNDAGDANDIADLADEFVAAVKKAATSDAFRKRSDFESFCRGMTGGWPGSMYGISKLCEATYTRKLAEQYKGKVDINACCPGYVSTDMSSHRGTKHVIDGADTPVWLTLLAPKGTTGKFFSDRTEESF